MSALIYLDLAHIHPIVNGQWHRARLVHVPRPGEAVTMLCGVSAAAEYDESGQRDARGPATQCWGCDLIYRREIGYEIPANHPGLRPRPVPHPR